MFSHRLVRRRVIPRIILLLGGGALAAGFSLLASPKSLAQDSTEPVVATQPLVTVTGGQVQGRYLPLPGGAAFKGIPYAAPPVGDLRWRETQPVKPWKGVLQAGLYGPPCPQLLQGGNVQIVDTTNENCLSLNVWAPQWPPSSKRPVMMWLHGGSGVNGSAQGDLEEGRNGITPPFDGTSLARHGVVVVTINYRMGLLGMIGHPDLTAELPHHASDNYSILDVIAALQWIHDNITRFGGDPNNVTVFGQSEGAHFSALLLALPLSKGLIHRAILESNAFNRPYLTPDQLEQLGLVMAEVLKAPATDPIKYLRALPASAIVDALPEVMRRLKERHLAFEQGIDGYVIPRNPGEVYQSHQEAPIPMILGNSALDAGASSAADTLGPNASQGAVLNWMKGALQSFYGKYPDLLERALKVYGINGASQLSTNPTYGTPAEQLGVDLHHRCADAVAASWHSTLAPTWQYEFTRTTPLHPPLHEAELRFVWGGLGDEEKDGNAQKLSSIMEGYWANFAKTGNPNGPGLPAWPKYNDAMKPYVDFSNKGVVQKAAKQAEACNIYVEKFNRDTHPLLGGDTRAQ